MKKHTIILGIDPGFALTGFGVILCRGGELELLDYGCVKTLAGEIFSERLKYLSSSLTAIIKKYQPDLAAVEELFFAKNVKTALQVGHARGVILLTVIQAKVPLVEFTPLQVKQAVSGYGRADKRQIQQMVKIILKMDHLPCPDDAADALAAAICAAAGRFNCQSLLK